MAAFDNQHDFDLPDIEACPVCNGSGVIGGPDEFGNYDVCDDCEGSGQVGGHAE